MSFTSYAQNFEDVMLWRALKQVEDGFYIDIGAQDPVIDSVSLAFYEHGWRGIHVEPTKQYADKLSVARPDETVLQVAVGDGGGPLAFFEFNDTGLSTADPAIARRHREAGFEYTETRTPVVSLDDILDQSDSRPVHWLKLDVEGLEQSVLESWRHSTVRPWILVIESTLPMTQAQNYAEWEPLVLSRGYAFAYFDGLNRFYVALEHVELKRAFDRPPNVFDNFSLSGTASQPFYGRLSNRVQLAEAKAQEALIVATEEKARSEQIQATLNAILQSRSWRLTAPLRRLNSALTPISEAATMDVNTEASDVKVVFASRLRRTAIGLLNRLPFSLGQRIRRHRSAFNTKKRKAAFLAAKIPSLETYDFNHLLHYLRTQALEGLPKRAPVFVSVGCAGTWYFQWIEKACGPLGRHIGIEFYTPKPDDLPPNVQWIENTAANMSSIDTGCGDILFSGQNIEHLWPSDVAGFLLESHRVLKEGGLLVVDSPNRSVTRALTWSHPEHTVELRIDEVEALLRASGFEVTARRGMWTCLDDSDDHRPLQLDEFSSTGHWPMRRRIEHATKHPESAFSWWIEARRTSVAPDSARVHEILGRIFATAWTERVNRLLTITGHPEQGTHNRWFSSRGQAGALLYGPYMPLPAGRYTVGMLVEAIEPARQTAGGSTASIEVVSGDGSVLASQQVLHELNAGPIRIGLDFALSTMTFGLQFRVITRGPSNWRALREVELKSHDDPSLTVERKSPLEAND